MPCAVTPPLYQQCVHTPRSCCLTWGGIHVCAGAVGPGCSKCIEGVREEQLPYGGWRWSSILAPPSAQEVEQSRVFGGGGGGGHELLKATWKDCVPFGPAADKGAASPCQD